MDLAKDLHLGMGFVIQKDRRSENNFWMQSDLYKNSEEFLLFAGITTGSILQRIPWTQNIKPDNRYLCFYILCIVLRSAYRNKHNTQFLE